MSLVFHIFLKTKFIIRVLSTSYYINKSGIRNPYLQVANSIKYLTNGFFFAESYKVEKCI